MTVDEMLKKLFFLREKLGNVEVLITDGMKGNYYRGDYTIEKYDGFIDIGIGGCEEEPEE